MIEQCFDDLSHSLRIFMENYWNFPELGKIDFNEAVGNLDISFNAILNSMHSLYDAHKQKNGKSNWHLQVEFLTVVAIRNARHHNNVKKIRQFLHIASLDSPTNSYLLISPKPAAEDARVLEYYIKLSDFDDLLKQNTSSSRLPNDARQKIHSYLNWGKIEAIAKKENILMENVFYNAIPLIINAGIIIYPDIAKSISGKSTESEIFKSFFEDIALFQMQNLNLTID